jgi:hypothetical protein
MIGAMLCAMKSTISAAPHLEERRVESSQCVLR